MQPTGLIKLNGKGKDMPQGKGTYGKTMGRPPMKKPANKKKPMKKKPAKKKMGY